MATLKEYKKRRMKTPDFKEAYEELAPLLEIRAAIIEARNTKNITQKDLAEKTGIAQTEISKIENGTRNPSVKLLQRLANGLDMELHIEFLPKRTKGDAKSFAEKIEGKIK